MEFVLWLENYAAPIVIGGILFWIGVELRRSAKQKLLQIPLFILAFMFFSAIPIADSAVGAASDILENTGIEASLSNVFIGSGLVTAALLALTMLVIYIIDAQGTRFWDTIAGVLYGAFGSGIVISSYFGPGIIAFVQNILGLTPLQTLYTGISNNAVQYALFLIVFIIGLVIQGRKASGTIRLTLSRVVFIVAGVAAAGTNIGLAVYEIATSLFNTLNLDQFVSNYVSTGYLPIALFAIFVVLAWVISSQRVKNKKATNRPVITGLIWVLPGLFLAVLPFGVTLYEQLSQIPNF